MESPGGYGLDGAPSLARDVFAASRIRFATRGDERGGEEGEDDEQALHGAIIGWSFAEGNPRNGWGHIREGIV